MKGEMMTRSNQLYDLYNTDWEDRDFNAFKKCLKKCNESDLREAFGNNKNALINIIYVGIGDGFDYVSQDFIREMFSNLKKRDKEYLQENIYDSIYCIADDVCNDNKNTVKYCNNNMNWLFKVGCYIKYCKPENERIKKQYDIIMNELFYYMYMGE